MPLQSLELLLEPALDAAVRAEWAALHAAGVPSLATHTGETNRPHVTLVASRAPFEQVTPLDVSLPVSIRSSGLLVFGASRAGGAVLARAVVPSIALLDLHAHVSAAFAGEPTPTSVRGDWTPHITLARRLDPQQLAAAVEVLGVPDLHGTAIGLRQWDAAARAVTLLAGGN